MAAGLAHEPNNPADSGSRSPTQLHHIFKILPSVNLGLQGKMTAKQLELEQNLANEHAKSSILDSLIQSDREDQITSWLDGHGISDG